MTRKNSGLAETLHIWTDHQAAIVKLELYCSKTL